MVEDDGRASCSVETWRRGDSNLSIPLSSINQEVSLFLNKVAFGHRKVVRVVRLRLGGEEISIPLNVTAHKAQWVKAYICSPFEMREDEG